MEWRVESGIVESGMDDEEVRQGEKSGFDPKGSKTGRRDGIEDYIYGARGPSVGIP
jgi:hypothetical protein